MLDFDECARRNYDRAPQARTLIGGGLSLFRFCLCESGAHSHIELAINFLLSLCVNGSHQIALNNTHAKRIKNRSWTFRWSHTRIAFAMLSPMYTRKCPQNMDILFVVVQTYTMLIDLTIYNDETGKSAFSS